MEKLRLAVLDTLAAILSGVHEEITRHVVGTLVDGSGGGEATVIGHRLRTGLGPAALANGIMGHACDYDDNSWTLWGHPTAPALPAVLAAAERRRLSGLDVLTALAAALEVEKALGIGCQPLHYSIGWHPTADSRRISVPPRAPPRRSASITIGCRWRWASPRRGRRGSGSTRAP